MDGRPEPVAENIWRVTNATFGTNTYICRMNHDGEAFLIDPGLETEWIVNAVDSLDLRPTSMFCTHGHFDHIGSVSVFSKRGIPWHLHPLDISTAKRSNFMMMAFRVRKKIRVPTVDVEVHEGFSVKLGPHTLTYLETPGHTPGSCAIQWGPHLFSGDTLYARGIGLSQLPGADSVTLRTSIQKIFQVVDPDVLVLPGHGESALLSDIEENNQPLRQFLTTASDADEAR